MVKALKFRLVYLDISGPMFSDHVVMLLVHTPLLALAATGATALVIDLSAALIERQTLEAINRTYVCQENTWGGCCKGFDDLNYGTGCEIPPVFLFFFFFEMPSRQPHDLTFDRFQCHIGGRKCRWDYDGLKKRIRMYCRPKHRESLFVLQVSTKLCE
jgi:hypothetical protein